MMLYCYLICIDLTTATTAVSVCSGDDAVLCPDSINILVDDDLDSYQNYYYYNVFVTPTRTWPAQRRLPSLRRAPMLPCCAEVIIRLAIRHRPIGRARLNTSKEALLRRPRCACVYDSTYRYTALPLRHYSQAIPG